MKIPNPAHRANKLDQPFTTITREQTARLHPELAGTFIPTRRHCREVASNISLHCSSALIQHVPSFVKFLKASRTFGRCTAPVKPLALNRWHGRPKQCRATDPARAGSPDRRASLVATTAGHDLPAVMGQKGF